MAIVSNSVERIVARIRRNPIISLVVVLSTVVIGLSSFTNAAGNLLSLFARESRPAVNGQWQAEVAYAWDPSRRHVERFSFMGTGDRLQGSASFLGVPRGVLEGKAVKNRLHFVTKTQKMTGDWNQPQELVHRYEGRLVGDDIQFVMQTEDASGTTPLTFTAKRQPASP